MAKLKKESKSTNDFSSQPSSNVRSQKLEALKIAMQQIDKQYGTGSIMKLGESSHHLEPISIISTGSIALDIALGVGGLPRGRIIEI
ncbi:MAG: Protein recA, partial [uncultured bacterium]